MNMPDKMSGMPPGMRGEGRPPEPSPFTDRNKNGIPDHKEVSRPEMSSKSNSNNSSNSNSGNKGGNNRVSNNKDVKFDDAKESVFVLGRYAAKLIGYAAVGSFVLGAGISMITGKTAQVKQAGDVVNPGYWGGWMVGKPVNGVITGVDQNVVTPLNRSIETGNASTITIPVPGQNSLDQDLSNQPQVSPQTRSNGGL